jgi:hypothetical protein
MREYQLYMDIDCITWCHTFTVASDKMAVEYSQSIARVTPVTSGRELRLFSTDPARYIARVIVENKTEIHLIPGDDHGQAA